MARKPADQPQVEVKEATLEERVSSLEVLLSTSFVTPVLEGRTLERCACCSAFATRVHRFEHPHSATCYQPSCDDCGLKHPLSGHDAAVITTEPIPNYPEACVEMGRKINASRKAVVARFAR